MAARDNRKLTSFKEGDKVWLDSRNLKLAYHSKKFTPRREGPFTISEVLGPVTYRLKLPNQWKIHNVFHADLLSRYKETEVHGPNYLEPAPELIEGEEEWEVDKIVAHKKRQNGCIYKVLWKGYPISEASWEPARNLQNAKEILNEYKKRKKLN